MHKFRTFIYFTFVLYFILLFKAFAYAQVMPENPDEAKLIMDLVTNYKSMGSVALAMTSITLLVQFLKWAVLKDFYEALGKKIGDGKVKVIKQLSVYVLGLAYSVLFLIKNGTPWAHAFMGVLVGGGAINIYNLVKPLWKKYESSNS